MKYPKDNYYALLIKSENKISEIANNLSQSNELPFELICLSSDHSNAKNSDILAIASLIVNYLEEKQSARLSFDEREDLIEKFIRAIKRQEKNIKALTELAPQDRYNN